MHISRTLVACFLCLVLAPALLAQGAGSINGIVVDPSGAVIPGAKVTATGTGKTYTAVTNELGEFVFPAVPYGTYQVTIEAAGFRQATYPDVVVEVARATVLRAHMEVGAIASTVTVEAATAVVNTVDAEVSTVVNKQQMTDLPLITRSPLNLVGLQAGVAVSTNVRNSIISGLRGQANNVTQDGINVQDNYIRNDGLFAQSAPNVESTGEFTIIANNLSADSGSGLAQVRIVTTRGTDQFHGSVYYYHRNDFFNANLWENNQQGLNPDGTPVAPRERLRQHRFGFSAGGPVYVPKLYDGRNRSYFFVRYEGFRENFAASRTRTVLTQAARQGMYSYVAQSAGTHPLTGAAFNAGDTVTVDLLALPALTGAPTYPLNPITTELINATPLPNNTTVGDTLNTSGFSFNANGSDPSDAITLRFDQKLAGGEWGTHWLEVVWNRFKSRLSPDTFNSNDAPFPSTVTGGNCPGAMCIDAGQGGTRNSPLAVAIHSTFGASVFNEVRFGFSRSPVDFLRDSPFPRSYRLDFPTITDPELNFLDQGRISPFYTILDNFTKVWGTHTFKAGYQAHSRNAITFNDAGTIPTITINPTSQGAGFGGSEMPGADPTDVSRAQNIFAIVTGLLDESTQTFNAVPGQGFVPGATRAEHAREREHDFYFQDSWRLHPTFTFNYGLRWEIVRPVDIVSDNALQPIGLKAGLFSPYPEGPLFTPDSSITFNDLLNGTVQPTMLDLIPRRQLWKQDWNNFAPFIGLAWSPGSQNPILRFLFGGPGQGALRAGFSTSYVREGLTVAVQPLRSNDGFVTDAGNSTPSGPLTSAPDGGAPITTPAFSLPVNQLDNWILSGANSGMFTFDPNMRTPYVLQWTLGIQREIAPQTRFEVRYVGNHAVKLIRGVDIGEVDTLGNGMFGEFQAAQTNRACNQSFGQSGYGNRGNPCNVATPLLTAMNWPFFTNSTFVGYVDRGEVGEFTHQVMRQCTFRFFAGIGCTPGLGSFAANFFRVNPYSILDDFIGNQSDSNYHALEMEVVRRFSRGLFLQANYTFSKAITDFDGDVQNTFKPHLTLTDPEHQRARSSFDVRHSFNMNGIWQFPVGRGRTYLSQGVFGRVLEGWQLGGIWTWRSGRPLNIWSGRGTFNRAARSAPTSAGNEAVLLGGLTTRDVCDAVGVHREADGAFFLPASFRDSSTGRADSAQFGHPGAGELGDSGLRYFCSGPSNFNLDINLVKRTSVTEQLAVEFRAEFFNIFNTPNFLPTQTGGNSLITSSTFTKITDAGSTFSPREIQFNLRIIW